MKSFRVIAGLALALGLIVPALASNVFILVNPVAPAVLPTAPTMGGAGNTVSWTQGGSATVIDSGLTVSGTITGATVSISSGFVAGDVIAFTNTATITGNYNAGTGQMVLSGTDSAAHYQTAFRGMTFSSTADSPTNSGGSLSRTVTWIGLNGASGSTAVASTANVVELPTLAGIGSGNVFTQGAGAITLSPAITASDFSAANFTSATVSVTSTFLSSDTLAANTTGTSITASYNTGTGVMTLSNSDTLAHYQQVMRTLTYNYTGSDVTNGGADLTRTITWAVTDANSNSSTTGSQLINVTTGSTVMPAWVPSWAATGSISCNYTVNPSFGQCWTGANVVNATTYLATTRSTVETCESANTVTTVAVDVPCINANGLGVWPASTNIVWPSDDITLGNWQPFTTGGTISVVPNSVTGPDGGANDAGQITIVNSAAGQSEIWINNRIVIPATGSYTISCWLKADGATPSGTQISMGGFDGVNSAGSTLTNVTLTKNWQKFSKTITQNTGTGITPGVQLYVGITANSSVIQPSYPATIVFDVWRCQEEAGAVATPGIQTVTAPVSRPIDNILVTSTMSSLFAGTTGTYLIQAVGPQGAAGTILDSNGNSFAGKTVTNTFTTALPNPGGPSTTTNWTNPANPPTVAEAWDATGRTMALNAATIFKDGAAPVPHAPFSLGSKSGTSNSFAGYIQLATVAPTRVPDSTIGLTSGSLNFFFAAAGSDVANTCTNQGTPCQTLAKAQSISYNPGYTINLNRGDSFTGCLNLTAGTNFSGSASNPVVIQGYGTGANPKILPNCTAGSAKIGAITLGAVTGLTINGITIVCDTAGNTGNGIRMFGLGGSGNPTGNIVIENSQISGCHDGQNSDFGGNIFTDPGGGPVTQVSILNNTLGTTTGSPLNVDDNGLTSYSGDLQYALVQGNVFVNIGGKGGGFNGSEGNGALIVGNGSHAIANGHQVQFNLSHDTGHNSTTCGGPYGIWADAETHGDFVGNEIYNVTISGGCDAGGMDMDQSTTNTIMERNYIHITQGPGMINFETGGTSWGGNTYRFNIAENTGTTDNLCFYDATNGNSNLWRVYNNTCLRDTNHTVTGTHYTVQSDGCSAGGTLFANNAVVMNAFGDTVFLAATSCTAPANYPLFLANGWYNLNASSSFFYRIGNASASTFPVWQSIVNGGDAGGKGGTNPTFAGPTDTNAFCILSTGSSGPGNCPSGYALGGGSTFSHAGNNLTATQGIDMGGVDYFGTALSGNPPIGASQ